MCFGLFSSNQGTICSTSGTVKLSLLYGLLWLKMGCLVDSVAEKDVIRLKRLRTSISSLSEVIRALHQFIYVS
jgi:hypothetical protein